MRTFYTTLIGAILCTGAISMTSCVQDDVAKAPELSSRTIEVEGIVLVNNDVYEDQHLQVWSAPDQQVEIEFIIPNSNLSDIGASTTIVRTKCDPSTGRFNAKLPIGKGMSQSVDVIVKSFRGTLTMNNPQEYGSPITVGVIWHDRSVRISIREGSANFVTFRFNGNDSNAFTII